VVRASESCPEPAIPTPAPGPLQVHQAADGALARIRLPVGILSVPSAAGAAGPLGYRTVRVGPQIGVVAYSRRPPNTTE
jgi:hypothetical protein